MAKGISIYFGEQNLTEMKNSVKLAHELNYEHVFTSLHLPEVDFKPLLNDFTELGKFCYKQNMKLMVDVSPKSFSYFSYDEFLEFLERSKVSNLRIDFGLSIETIIKLSNSNRNFNIVLNASTILAGQFEGIIFQGLNLSHIETCHNFYPRPETGISESFFIDQTNYFKSKGLKVSAFIPASTGKRAPIFEGLPTIEKHRNIKSSLAFRHLKLLGTDNVYFGDNKTSEEELETVANLKEDVTALEFKTITENPKLNSLFSQSHTDRPEVSECVIRSQESRLTLSSGSFNKIIIEPENCIERKKGDITIDNKLYKRYAGELQICRQNLKQDSRVNVIGKISDDNLFLLSYINKSKRFHFINPLIF